MENRQNSVLFLTKIKNIYYLNLLQLLVYMQNVMQDVW